MEKLQIGNQTIGNIVANNFRTYSIFKNAGIDFCCGGKKLFSEICQEKGIDGKKLEDKIQKISKEPINEFMEFKNWNLSFLCDYIINTHHKFALNNISELRYYTQKIADVHSINHTELKPVAQLFEKLGNELVQHMKNEEEILFPAIKKLDTNKIEKAKDKKDIDLIISTLYNEHEIAGEIMHEINKITDGYHVPDDGCNTYKVTLKMLEQFEDDLHIHIHLENNILFPKTMELI